MNLEERIARLEKEMADLKRGLKERPEQSKNEISNIEFYVTPFKKD